MNDIDGIFKLLEDWRKLPAYQLERRADIFFAYFLPEIMKERFGVEYDIEDRHKHIIPEFPLRQNKETFRSDKVDYAVIGNNATFLVELKTNESFYNEKQVDYLIRAKEKEGGLNTLIEEIFEIRYSPNSDDKYEKLIERLYSVPNIGKIPFDNGKSDLSSDVLQLLNRKSLNPENLMKVKDEIRVNSSAKPEIVYIVPKLPEKQKPDDSELTLNHRDSKVTFKVITFANISSVLRSYEESNKLASSFQKSLEEWLD